MKSKTTTTKQESVLLLLFIFNLTLWENFTDHDYEENVSPTNMAAANNQKDFCSDSDEEIRWYHSGTVNLPTFLFYRLKTIFLLKLYNTVDVEINYIQLTGI